MNDQDVRDFLDRMVAEEPVPFLDPEPLARRGRRRAARTVIVGAIGVAAAIAVLSAGVASIRSTPVPADEPTRTPDLGIFAPVAGRIVYFDTGHIGLSAVDPSAASTSSTLIRLDLQGTPAAERFAQVTKPLGWSRDGTELLLMHEDPAGRFQDGQPPFDSYLFILHADGTETKVTTEPVGGAAISSDGSRVVFATTEGRLYVVDEGGQPVRIAEGAASPTISPDGTQIAYLSMLPESTFNSAGRAPVWVVNADGTDAHEILADEPALANGIFHLRWSPTGDRIAAGNLLSGHFAIYTFAPDGSDFTEVVAGGVEPYWSPDGSQIAYQEPGGGVVIADADGSNIRPLGLGNSGPWHPGTPEAAVGSTSPPNPFKERFDSQLNGLSISYPSGWRTQAATEPWGGKITFDAPDVDLIFDPKFRDDLYIAVVSEPLGSKLPRDWVLDHTDSPSLGVCYTGGAGGTGVGFQGNAAWFQHCDEPTGGGGNIVIFATATRGYIIYNHVGDEKSLQMTYDSDWFERSVLQTVVLPEEAPDTSTPLASP